ncbi:MAG: hypothetical protein JJT78_18045 [Leptospira sp.]|nr:hypothetical protein [Leptospira sp.]
MVKKKSFFNKFLIFTLFIGCMPFEENPIDPNSPFSNLLLLNRLQNLVATRTEIFRPSLGELDTSFGVNGVRFSTFSGIQNIGYRIDVDNLGRIYQVGWTGDGNWNLVLVRFLSDGLPDSSFSNNSVYTSSSIRIGNITNPSVILMPDSDVIISGRFDSSAELIRLTPEGQPQSSFGISGIRTLPGDLIPSSLKVDSPGFLYTVGTTTGTPEAYFSKHHPGTGSLTSDFGTAGLFSTEVVSGTFSPTNEDFHINSDGSIISCGYLDTSGSFDYESFVLKLNSSGALDAGFGDSGVAYLESIIPAGTTISSLTVDASGGIYIVGRVNSSGFVGKLLPSGSLDTSFGQDGFLLLPSASLENFTLTKILRQPDGNLLVGGHVGPANQTRIFIARLFPNGAFDSTFGQNGIFELSFGTNNTLHDMHLLPNGNILISGHRDSSFYLGRIR